MAQGGKISESAKVNLEKVQSDVSKLYKLVKAQPQISRGNKAAIKSLYGEVVRNLAKSDSTRAGPRSVGARTRRSSSQFMRPASINESAAALSSGSDKLPLLHLKRKVGTNWQYSSKLTSVYLDVLQEIATSGTTWVALSLTRSPHGPESLTLPSPPPASRARTRSSLVSARARSAARS